MTGHIEDGDESLTPELTDVVHPAEAARHGVQGITDLGLKSNAEVHILEAGHFALDEATDEIAVLIRDFLARLDEHKG